MAGKREVIQIASYATAVGILHPGMESIPETRHGKTGESAKKTYKNDLGIQGF